MSQQPSSLLELQDRIRWLCHAMRGLVIIWLLWILGRISWSMWTAADKISKINESPIFKDHPVAMSDYLKSSSIGLFNWLCLLPIGFAAWALVKGYLKGDIFSEQSATRLHRLGQAAMFATLISIALRPLSSWLFSSHYFSTLNWWQFLDPADLLYFIIGAFILSIAHIYRNAAEISTENKQFI